MVSESNICLEEKKFEQQSETLGGVEGGSTGVCGGARRAGGACGPRGARAGGGGRGRRAGGAGRGRELELRKLPPYCVYIELCYVG